MLSELATTTRRNRGLTGAKKEMKPSAKQLKAFEHSREDKIEDKKGAKRMGMTQKEYEGSAADRRADIRGAVKKAVSEVKSKSKK